jgi:hypothetical protein
MLHQMVAVVSKFTLPNFFMNLILIFWGMFADIFSPHFQIICYLSLCCDLNIFLVFSASTFRPISLLVTNKATVIFSAVFHVVGLGLGFTVFLSAQPLSHLHVAYIAGLNFVT